MDIVNTGNRTKNLEKRIDDMFISNNAKIAAIDVKTMSKLDRIQFDASGRCSYATSMEIAKPSDP
jgi:hypothetical protein